MLFAATVKMRIEGSVTYIYNFQSHKINEQPLTDLFQKLPKPFYFRAYFQKLA